MVVLSWKLLKDNFCWTKGSFDDFHCSALSSTKDTFIHSLLHFVKFFVKNEITVYERKDKAYYTQCSIQYTTLHHETVTVKAHKLVKDEGIRWVIVMVYVTLSVSSDQIVTNMVYRFLIINHKTIHERGVMERNMILERRRFELFLI